MFEHLSSYTSLDSLAIHPTQGALLRPEARLLRHRRSGLQQRLTRILQDLCKFTDEASNYQKDVKIVLPYYCIRLNGEYRSTLKQITEFSN